ncbi:hypothetical protein KY284_030223 [Solanum tuberosum]|nr:hypothetical protein KY284_030223 [Solanum tuberosum]
MDALNFPNLQMVINANYKLRNWWTDIKRDRKREIHILLGGLTYLIFVIPNPHLIRSLLEFWDPASTIEEISGFIELSYHECEMMVLYKPSSREFLKILGMKSNPTLPSLDLGWIHFDFLYSCFGRDDSYYSFSDEFECSVEEWETYRPNAFAISLLGSLVFPKIKGRIDTRLCYVNMVYHTRSKDALPSFLNENRKVKSKATNEKAKKLEEEVSDMRDWIKLLNYVDPTLETNIDKSPVMSQANFQNNPSPTNPTSHPPPAYPTPQNQPTSIQMPPRNTHFPNYPYPPQHHASTPPYLTPRLSSPPLQAPQYQTPLHQVLWCCAPLIP